MPWELASWVMFQKWSFSTSIHSFPLLWVTPIWNFKPSSWVSWARVTFVTNAIGYDHDGFAHHPCEGKWCPSCHQKDCQHFTDAKCPLALGQFPSPFSLCCLLQKIIWRGLLHLVSTSSQQKNQVYLRKLCSDNCHVVIVASLNTCVVGKNAVLARNKFTLYLTNNTFNPYPKETDPKLKWIAAKEVESSNFHQRGWRYLGQVRTYSSSLLWLWSHHRCRGNRDTHRVFLEDDDNNETFLLWS